jgi:flagellar basal-body rod protein FlgB
LKTGALFSETVALLARTLDVRSRNHNVIVSNIANADTPNYRSVHLEVEREMAEHTGSSATFSMQRTHPAHIVPAGQAAERVHIVPDRVPPGHLRGDGNTVDIDRSMGNLAENNLMYNAAAQIIQQKFQALITVIRGGNGGN